MLHYKKSQLSIFFLIIFIIGIAAVFVFQAEIEDSDTNIQEEQVTDLNNFNKNVDTFYLYSTTCLKQSALNALTYYDQRKEEANKKDMDIIIKPHHFVNIYLKLESHNCFNETLFPELDIQIDPPLTISVDETENDIAVKISLFTEILQQDLKKQINDYSFKIPKKSEDIKVPVSGLVVDDELFQFYLPLKPKNTDKYKVGEIIVSYNSDPKKSVSLEKTIQELPILERKKIFSDILLMITPENKKVQQIIESVQYDEIIRFDTEEASLEDVEEKLRSSPIVKKITRNKLTFSADLLTMSNFKTQMNFKSNFLNDHFYSHQWYLENNGQNSGKKDADIRIKDVWNITENTNGVLISVIDQGVASNPDIVMNINYEKSFNFIDHTAVIEPVSQEEIHGTHVAGVIASKSNNGFGIAGICPNCGIMNVKIFAAGQPSETTALLNAILFSAAQGADIISMSLGGPLHSDYEQELISGLEKTGILFVAASGNEGVDTKTYPAAYHDVISIGATDNTDSRAVFSNFGEWVHLYAPGETILSTCSPLTYCFSSGTSMATPIVSGIIGVMKSIDSAVTSEEALDILLTTADDTTAGKRVNAKKAWEETQRRSDEKNSLEFD